LDINKNLMNVNRRILSALILLLQKVAFVDFDWVVFCLKLINSFVWVSWGI